MSENREPSCPRCNSNFTYQDGILWVCPDCSHEWSEDQIVDSKEMLTTSTAISDAHGNILTDGDSVSIVKDLKIKGSSSVVKVGTKIKNIRLIENEDGHNISCRIEGMGSINLKSEFVKKI